MRKKTIYLHIGTPKTGTTSIQGYLANNTKKLRADGYLVPATSRHNHNANHIYLANYALNDDRSLQLRSICNTNTPNEILAFREQFYERLRDEISAYQGDYVILSNEHCYRCLNSKEETMRLKHLLEGLADQLEIIIYLREQSDMLCSQYSTNLKNNGRKSISDIEQFSEMNFLNYNQYMKVCEEVFGIENVNLKIYDKEKLYQGDVISDFCHTLNISRYEYKPMFLNASFNAKQCEFLRLINTQIGELKGGKGIKIRHHLNQMVHHTQIESPPVSALISKAYQCVYDESNRELAKRYLHHETELFHKKRLNDQALDQSVLLTEEDKKKLATQMIEKNRWEEEILCKCTAAIFDVSYKNRRIPIDYVRSFCVNDYEKKRKRTIGHYVVLFKKVSRRIKRRISNAHSVYR